MALADCSSPLGFCFCQTPRTFHLIRGSETAKFSIGPSSAAKAPNCNATGLCSRVQRRVSKLQLAENIRRFRVFEAPIRLFGECDKERQLRLDSLERLLSPEAGQLIHDGFMMAAGLVDAHLCEELLLEIRALEVRVDCSSHAYARASGDVVPEGQGCARLRITELARRAVDSASYKLKASLEAVLGPSPHLIEVGAITSMPGATRQQVHQDDDTTGRCATPGHAAVLTIWVSLQDIHDAMGPTEVFAGTHSIDTATQILALGDNAKSSDYEVLLDWESRKRRMAPLRKGDGFVMNRRCFHCGGANVSREPRTLFCFSLMSDVGETPETILTSVFLIETPEGTGVRRNIA